jgi:hypothetical protein
MAYEMFTRTGVRVDSPTVSITPEGRVTFNAAATRTLASAGVKHVVLLWDRLEQKMAARATSKSDRNGYAVSLAPDKHAGSLRAKSFLQHIGWSATRREMLPAAWNAAEKMFEVRLPAQYLRAGQETIGRKQSAKGAPEVANAKGQDQD